MLFRKNIEVIPDVVGQPYLAAIFSWDEVEFFMPKYYSIEKEHEKFSAMRKARDGKEFHLTFLNVAEYSKLLKDAASNNNYHITQTLKAVQETIVSIDLKGIGTASNEKSKTYFIVCKSPALDDFRSSLALPEKDFHITVGFNPTDVFGVRKNEVI